MKATDEDYGNNIAVLHRRTKPITRHHFYRILKWITTIQQRQWWGRKELVTSKYWCGDEDDDGCKLNQVLFKDEENPEKERNSMDFSRVLKQVVRQMFVFLPLFESIYIIQKKHTHDSYFKKEYFCFSLTHRKTHIEKEREMESEPYLARLPCTVGQPWTQIDHIFLACNIGSLEF